VKIEKLIIGLVHSEMPTASVAEGQPVFPVVSVERK
jgi:hypothetical protein